jgi:poly(A) polymerase
MMDILSADPPSVYDVQCSESLRVFLAQQEKTTQQQIQRELVISELSTLLQTWSPQEESIHLVTFGSYRLGVNASSADIDALCVGVKSLKREDFFTGMMLLLKSHSKISKLVAVPNAFVPVIKMCLDGIDIDLIFANINTSRICPNLNLSDEKWLKDASPIDVRCLNGSRVTDKLFHLVPNHKNFREMILLLKFWAKQRGIHSNALGFLPGIAINILCARVCQLYPNAAPAYLVYKFFHIFGKLWVWPNPVVLHNSQIVSDKCLELQSWDPKLNFREKNDLMPVLTPAFPCTNSCYAVTKSGFRIIQSEFRRGLAIMQSMYGANRISSQSKIWNQLCAPSSFFQDYKVYITITVSAHEQDFEVWQGVVVAKIRKLVMQLEHDYPSTQFQVFPSPKKESSGSIYYIGVHSESKVKLEIARVVDAFRLDIDKTIGADKTPSMIVAVDAVFGCKKRKK